VWISEQTAIISQYSINWLGIITEMDCVYCAVRNTSSNQRDIVSCLTLILLTQRIGWAPNNASKGQMGFNSAFKGLNDWYQRKLWVCKWRAMNWVTPMARFQVITAVLLRFQSSAIWRRVTGQVASDVSVSNNENICIGSSRCANIYNIIWFIPSNTSSMLFSLKSGYMFRHKCHHQS
jgi:hypothetical protein